MPKSAITFNVVENDDYPNPNGLISTGKETVTYGELVENLKRQTLAKKNQPKDPYASITPRRSYGKKNQRFPKGYI